MYNRTALIQNSVRLVMWKDGEFGRRTNFAVVAKAKQN